MTIGQRIKKRRKELKLSADEVAAKLGKDRSTVYRYENGDIGNFPTDILEPLAKILDTTPAHLMGWDEELPSNVTPLASLPMIPVVGNIAAGQPILAQENIIGYIPTDIKNPDEYFYLHVEGDSMINAGIPDGSDVLIRKQNCADNGQIVACFVNGDSATLKRFKRLDDTVFLIPENTNYEPIIIKPTDFEAGYARILGVAVRCVISKNL